MKDLLAAIGLFYLIITVGIFLMSWYMNRKPKSKMMKDHIGYGRMKNG